MATKRFAYNPADPNAVMVMDDAVGGYRPATDPEREQFYLNFNVATAPHVSEALRAADVIKDEQGVSNWERFKLKWFGQNKAAVKRSLEAMNYEVREYGDGLADKLGVKINFAVRKKGDGGKFRLMDPENSILDAVGSGAGALEFAKDIFDMAADYTQGSIMASFAAGGAAIGAPLGPGGALAGGIAGGAIAGIGTEGIRQGIGTQLGLQQTPDVSQSAMVGLGGALGPPIAGAVGGGLGVAAGRIMDLARFTKKAAADGALELSARVAGVNKSNSIILPEEAIFETAMSGKERLLTPFEAAKKVGTDILTKLRKSDNIPERKIANEMLDEMARRNNGTYPTVDLSPLVARLEENIPRVAGEAIKKKVSRVRITSQETAKKVVESQRVTTPFKPTPTGRILKTPTSSGSIIDEDVLSKSVAKQTATTRESVEPVMALSSAEAALRKGTTPGIESFSAETIDDIAGYLSVAGPDGAPISLQNVPLPVAENVRRMLASKSRVRGAYGAAPVDKEIGKYAEGIERSASRIIKEEADRTGVLDGNGRNFSAVMAQLDTRLQDRKRLIKFMGVPHLNPERMRNGDWQKLETNISNVFGKDHGATLRFIEQVEDDMGVEILRPFREATVSQMVGRYGELPTAPRITATGGILGMAAGGPVGTIASLATGNDPYIGTAVGGAVGGAAGLAMGSPRMQRNMIRFTAKADKVVGDAMSAFGDTVGPPIAAAAAPLPAMAGSVGGRALSDLEMRDLLTAREASRQKLRIR